MRALVRHAFYRGQRRLARLWTQRHSGTLSRGRLPIFLLHSIATGSSSMAVSETSLRSQLRGLLDAGYRCIDLADAIRALAASDPLPQPSFCLTFDDGYRSVSERGMRILEDLNLTATLFLTVNFIEGRVRPPWHSTHPAMVREYSENAEHFHPLEWSQVREIIAGGRVRVGSHSMNHHLAGRLDESSLWGEIGDAKKILEERLGVEVPFFSYPYGTKRYGAYSARTEAVVRQAGYRCSCVSEIGRAKIGGGSWLLPRIPLEDQDTPLDACAKAAGAYDWVAIAQRFFQRIFPNPHIP